MTADEKMLVFVLDNNTLYLKSLIMNLDMENLYKMSFKYFYNSNDLNTALNKANMKPDLILMDYYINNEVSGIDVIKKIKPVGKDADIILFGAAEEQAMISAAIAPEAFTYVTKRMGVLQNLGKILDEKLIQIGIGPKKEKEKKLIAFTSMAIVVLMIVALFAAFDKSKEHGNTYTTHTFSE